MGILAEVNRERVTYTSDNMLEGLSHELIVWRNLDKKNNTWSRLSKKLGGHPKPGTISRIAYRDTKEPRMTTVILLYVGLGFSIRVERDG